MKLKRYVMSLLNWQRQEIQLIIPLELLDVLRDKNAPKKNKEELIEYILGRARKALEELHETS